MLTKNQVKFIRSLQQKKYRRQLGMFFAEGAKTVAELLESGIKIKSIYATSAWINQHEVNIGSGIELTMANPEDLKKISVLSTPAEVLCIAEIPHFDAPGPAICGEFSLALDKIQDPGNLGTIIRIADWFGIAQIFCSPDCADAYSPKVVQATMGSIARVKLYYLELPVFMQEIKAHYCPDKIFPIIGASTAGESIFEKKLPTNGMLVLGNESAGISEEVKQLTDENRSIPSFGKAESLNVAVAAGIFCFEQRRMLVS